MCFLNEVVTVLTVRMVFTNDTVPAVIILAHTTVPHFKSHNPLAFIAGLELSVHITTLKYEIDNKKTVKNAQKETMVTARTV